MLKKLKKFMVVAAAAVMLSAGFATVAPKEASAHWADKQMDMALREGVITVDLRNNLATRQDFWLMIARSDDRRIHNTVSSYPEARQWVIKNGISDGSRGTNWITRDEAVAMLYNHWISPFQNGWTPNKGFSNARNWGMTRGVYDGTRGSDFATRAEVVTMLYTKFIR